MPKFDIDLTSVGLIEEGNYEPCTINKVEYQIKTGAKWNNEGTSTVTRAEFENEPDESICRIHLTIAVPGKGNIFHDLYMKKTALGFTQAALKAAGVPFTKQGFDPDELLGKQVGLSIGVRENENGQSNEIKKMYKV